MNQDYLTAEVFNETFHRGLSELKNELKSFMMEGFTMLDKKIDYVDEHLSSRADEIMVTKADREEVFALHKRVAKLEKKGA